MRFGLSTHLFHGERLAPRAPRDDRRRTASTPSRSSRRARTSTTTTARASTRSRGWLDDARPRAPSACTRRSARASPHGVWGRAYLERVDAGDRARSEAVDETRRRASTPRGRLGCEIVVLHLGLPRGQEIPPGDNDAGAVRRSLEALARRRGDSRRPARARSDARTPCRRPTRCSTCSSDLELGDAGVCLDFGHAHLLGGAPEAAEALSGHIITTHVHDNKRPARQPPRAVRGHDRLAGDADGDVEDRLQRAAHLRGRRSRRRARPCSQRTVGARARLQAILDGLGRADSLRRELSSSARP